MKLKFHMNTVFLLLSYFCVFVSFPSFSYYNLMKYISMVLIGFYILMNIRILKRKEFVVINLTLLIFSLILIYTSWRNREALKLRDPLLASLVFTGMLMEFFLLMEITAVKENTKAMIKTYYVLALIVVVITDILAVMGIQLSTIGGNKYLIGTKFSVVYAHYWLIILFCTKSSCRNLKKYKIVLALLIGLTLLMSFLVDCSTGIVGVFILAIMLRLYRRYGSILSNPFVFISILIISFALSFIIQTILLWKPLQYIITNLLNRDITMTSRTKIFLLIPVLLRNHYWLGYGYGTSYELGQRLGGFPNTQNAMWEWIWQCGIVGTVLLLILIFCVVQYANKSNRITHDKTSKYMTIMLYIFSILAIVEITIDISYLAYLAMLIPLTYTRQKRRICK